MSASQYDIAIVGAGIVGCTMAGLLGKAQPNLKIALIDKQEPAAFDSGSEIDSRVYALNGVSKQLLSSLSEGVATVFNEDRACAYSKMTVWEDELENALSFNHEDSDADELGHILEHNYLHHAVYQSIKDDQPNISYIKEAVTGIEIDTDIASVECKKQTIKAKLVIGADGANSLVRSLVGIDTEKGTYLQSAIVANVKTEKHHQNTAWQRFLPSGPLALLPLANGESSIVWSLPLTEIDKKCTMPEAEFLRDLSEQSQAILGDAVKVTERRQFPLSFLSAKQYCKPRVALVGDAAHVVHPLAGQGLNLGLLDVKILSEVIGQATKQGADIGQLHIIKRYQTQSRNHNKVMLSAMGSLNSLFSSSNPWLKSIRVQGLQWVNKLSLLKLFFTKQAIGKL